MLDNSYIVQSLRKDIDLHAHIKLPVLTTCTVESCTTAVLYCAHDSLQINSSLGFFFLC